MARVVSFPYGNDFLTYTFPAGRFKGELVSRINQHQPGKTREALVDESLANPIGSKRLSELAAGKKNIVLLASDHTRPVPSKIIIPGMLAEIRRGSPDADITILIATGCHREMNRKELENKFGPKILHREKIVTHDCDS
ncbi:MAG: lactate racemase domain-containing protein, partial [Treponema sp.]|nr:lactate racemase domain-containing protein [Treponema sp.]